MCVGMDGLCVVATTHLYGWEKVRYAQLVIQGWQAARQRVRDRIVALKLMYVACRHQ